MLLYWLCTLTTTRGSVCRPPFFFRWALLFVCGGLLLVHYHASLAYCGAATCTSNHYTAQGRVSVSSVCVCCRHWCARLLPATAVCLGWQVRRPWLCFCVPSPTSTCPLLLLLALSLMLEGWAGCGVANAGATGVQDPRIFFSGGPGFGNTEFCFVFRTAK